LFSVRVRFGRLEEARAVDAAKAERAKREAFDADPVGTLAGSHFVTERGLSVSVVSLDGIGHIMFDSKGDIVTIDMSDVDRVSMTDDSCTLHGHSGLVREGVFGRALRAFRCVTLSDADGDFGAMLGAMTLTRAARGRGMGHERVVMHEAPGVAIVKPTPLSRSELLGIDTIAVWAICVAMLVVIGVFDSTMVLFAPLCIAVLTLLYAMMWFFNARVVVMNYMEAVDSSIDKIRESRVRDAVVVRDDDGSRWLAVAVGDDTFAAPVSDVRAEWRNREVRMRARWFRRGGRSSRSDMHAIVPSTHVKDGTWGQDVSERELVADDSFDVSLRTVLHAVGVSGFSTGGDGDGGR
jgi:hypothetical protein